MSFRLVLAVLLACLVWSVSPIASLGAGNERSAPRLNYTGNGAALTGQKTELIGSSSGGHGSSKPPQPSATTPASDSVPKSNSNTIWCEVYDPACEARAAGRFVNTPSGVFRDGAEVLVLDSESGRSAAPARPQLTAEQVREVVRRASAQVVLPAPQPSISPSASANEWGMLFVGLPIWVTAASSGPIDASTTQQGIHLTLTARPGATSVDMGDGTTITCNSMTARPENAAPLAKSPDCGHVYTTRGEYTVTATTTWTIEWAALGQSGSIPMSRSATTSVKIGELESVVVR